MAPVARISAVLFVTLAATACATGSDRDADERPPSAVISGDGLLIAGFDTDGDFRTTRAEFEQGLAVAFATADSDGDGALSPLEWQSWSNRALGGDLIGPFRLEVDRNVDNVTTQEEFVTEFQARFTGYDTDNDGAVSRPELVRQLRTPGDRTRLQPRRPQPEGGPGSR
jgi:hypothetical protein